MSVELYTLERTKYLNNLKAMLQEEGGLLRGTYMRETVNAAEQATPCQLIGQIRTTPITSQFQEKKRLDPVFEQPWYFPHTRSALTGADTIEMLRTDIKPNGKMVSQAAEAHGRDEDDYILNACFATRKVGKTPSTDIAFSSDYTISSTSRRSDLTTDAFGLTPFKIKEVIKGFAKANVNLRRESITMVISPEQSNDMLNEQEVQYALYARRATTDDNGLLKSYLGINFIIMNRLPISANIRSCPVYLRSGLALGVWNDIKIKMYEDNTTEGDPMMASSYMTMGATRIEEGRVWKVECSEDTRVPETPIKANS